MLPIHVTFQKLHHVPHPSIHTTIVAGWYLQASVCSAACEECVATHLLQAAEHVTLALTIQL